MTKHEIAPRRPQLESDWGKNRAHMYVPQNFIFRENAIFQIIFFFREINFSKEEILHFFFVKSNQFFFSNQTTATSN